MRGRNLQGSSLSMSAQIQRSNRSPILLITLSLLTLSFLFILVSLSPSHPDSAHFHDGISSSKPETSFVASLEHFLTYKAPRSPPVRDDTVQAIGEVEEAAKKLDEALSEKEMERMIGDPHYLLGSPVRVYVYEMPWKFTYDLLWLFRNTYRETSNLTSNGSPVHRLIEQALEKCGEGLSAGGSRPVLYPLLHNYQLLLDGETTLQSALQGEALKWVTDQPAWKRSEGRDHILPVHHPWSFKTVRKFMKNAIWLLADMDSTGNWYKPGQVYLEKDLILPYVPNVDLCDGKCFSDSQSKRSILLFFRGRLKRNAGGKIRAKLVGELGGADDVIIEEGTAGEGGKAAAQTGMRKSIFCLSPAGDTPSSARLFDAIVSGCIPVIISDELELPFEGILDYRKITLFVSSSDALKAGWLLTYLRSVSAAEIKKMQQNLVKFSRHFLYSSPAQPLGPEDLTWRMIVGKLVNIKLHTRRSQRVVKESRSLCTCECRRPNSTSPSPLM